MMYVCEDCSFVFCRSIEVQGCPSCEKKHIRPATEEEADRLQKLLEQGNTNL